MGYEIRKNATGYTLLITRQDGTQNDYRFNSKKELTSWLKAVQALNKPRRAKK